MCVIASTAAIMSKCCNGEKVPGMLFLQYAPLTTALMMDVHHLQQCSSQAMGWRFSGVKGKWLRNTACIRMQTH